jgi:catechol 2,3-dioxygenase-like lactoylglutathione lyase family enzyme
MTSPRSPLTGIYETVVYGGDIAAMVAFYRDVLGLRLTSDIDDIGASFRLPDGGMLLVFEPDGAAEPGRAVPPHGAQGPGHVAFSIRAGDYQLWLEHLRGAGVEIERELPWGTRGRSLYVRDPAGNSVELVAGDIWPP